jgi:hypothetical protein
MGDLEIADQVAGVRSDLFLPVAGWFSFLLELTMPPPQASGGGELGGRGAGGDLRVELRGLHVSDGPHEGGQGGWPSPPHADNLHLASGIWHWHQFQAHSQVFKIAIAGAPVTHWDGYDTHYTERSPDISTLTPHILHACHLPPCL